ncbi:MAG: ABC transporter ATP-binding protein [Paracoccaceae bacterium]
MSDPVPLLQTDGLHAWYGQSHILQGVDLEVGAGEVVALLGRNGAGRSTICRAIMGHLEVSGEILFRGTPITGLHTHQVAQAGIGLVPENREIFPGLTTRQNLLLGLKPGQRDGSGRWSSERLMDMFANLRARADVDAAVLSGGEQQMLSICRTLMGDPELVMIDEPTEGLSPQVTELVSQLLKQIALDGVAVLLVEQKLTIALQIADRVNVIGQGRVVFTGTPEAFAAAPDIRRSWLEV